MEVIYITVHSVHSVEVIYITVHSVHSVEVIYITVHTVQSVEVIYITVHSVHSVEVIYITVHSVHSVEVCVLCCLVPRLSPSSSCSILCVTEQAEASQTKKCIPAMYRIPTHCSIYTQYTVWEVYVLCCLVPMVAATHTIHTVWTIIMTAVWVHTTILLTIPSDLTERNLISF